MTNLLSTVISFEHETYSYMPYSLNVYVDFIHFLEWGNLYNFVLLLYIYMSHDFKNEISRLQKMAHFSNKP